MLEKLDEQKQGDADAQKKHAQRLLKRVKHFDKELKEREKQWKEVVKHINGLTDDDGQAGLVRTNIISSKLATIATNVYARAPEIAVSLNERLDSADYSAIKKFAKTLETALNTLFVKEANLKKVGKQAFSLAQLKTVAWAKVIYQNDVREDPQVKNRINDTQDNIERIKRLIKETEKANGNCDDHEAKLFELNQNVEALHKQIEVSVASGLVVDVIEPKDIIILDSACMEIDDYSMASAIAHRVKIPVSKFKDKYKKDPPQGTKFYADFNEKESAESDINDDNLVCMYEVWSMDDLTYYTLIEGYDGYIEEPRQPEKLGKQWYPFFPLQLRRVPGIKYPHSDAELLIELGEEYQRLRTAAAQHRIKNAPVRLMNKETGVTDPEILAINNRSNVTDILLISADPAIPLQDQIGYLPEIPFNPATYDVAPALFDIEVVSGAQDAASGAVRTSKTATEAEIQASGQQGRTSLMADVVEDWLSDMAGYAAQLLLQNVHADVIKQKFGDEAVWPQLSKEDVFNLVTISIRAGSSSRPNRMRERDQWIQLMPSIEKSIQVFSEAKQSNNEELKNLTINLLDETLRRFDEKLDAKTLLGINEEEEEAQEPQIPPEVIEQVKVMQAENEQLKQIAQQAQAQLQQMQQAQQQAEHEITMLKQEKDVLSKGNDVKHRAIDLQHREIEHKENELQGNQTMQENELVAQQVNIDAVQALVQQSASVAESVAFMVQSLSQEKAPEQEPPKRRMATARKMPDGSFVMESIEITDNLESEI